VILAPLHKMRLGVQILIGAGRRIAILLAGGLVGRSRFGRFGLRAPRELIMSKSKSVVSTLAIVVAVSGAALAQSQVAQGPNEAGQQGGSLLLLPSNDSCASAQVIAAVPFATSIDTTTATPDIPPGACNSFGATTMQNSVWYKWTATSYGIARFRDIAPYDVIVTAYRGTCGSLTELGCSANGDPNLSDTIVFPVEPGVAYFFKVGSVGTNSGGGANQITLDFNSNDECAGAFPLSCNATINADLATGTSNPADPAFTCRNPSAARGVNTLWYTFVPTTTHAVLTTGVVSGGAANDTLLAVYSGQCGSLSQVGCNDDFGAGFTSRVELFSLNVGQTYYVQLAGYDASEIGVYSLNLDCRPDYDDCASAPTLACNSQIVADLSLTTSSPGDPIFPCRDGGGAPGPGVNSAWFKFVASSNSVRITSGYLGGNANDTLLALYSGTCGSLVQVACNDDYAATFLSQIQVNTLTPGATYYIQLAAWTALTAGPYSLLLECSPDCATCPSGAVIENETCGFNFNGACTQGQPVSCTGANICGTFSQIGNSPDVDLYAFTIDAVMNVNWCVVSPERAQIAITANPFCEGSPIIYAAAFLEQCEPNCVSATLLPGSYFLGVALNDSSVLCSPVSHYTGTFTSSLYCPGDFNVDNRIDTADLVQLLLRFGTNATPCSAYDMAPSGFIDTADLVQFLRRFGALCLPPP